MTRYRVIRVLLTFLVGLIGVLSTNYGLHSLFGIVTGQFSRSNYPGILLCALSATALLPIAIVAVWKERLGNKLLIWCGAAGILGIVTMPCAWQPINRIGFLNMLLTSCVVALAGWGLASNAKSTSKLWPFI